MRIATIRINGRTACARVDGDTLAELDARDCSDLLGREDWLDAASVEGKVRHSMTTADFAPATHRPSKIICVGLNYAHHITEMGRELPTHPTLFAKFSEALIGANDSIDVPPETECVDWEAELALVIGTSIRRGGLSEAEDAIAGFTVANDVTMRDWQNRTMQWLQGKTFERTTPVGPVLVTPDELPGGVRPALRISCSVNGRLVQEARTNDLVFQPPELVAYISTMITLNPGDLILTGTPGGVGHGRIPPVYLQEGDELVTEIDGIGKLTNAVGRSAAQTG